MQLAFYIAKFCLLAMLYAAVYFSYRQTLRRAKPILSGLEEGAFDDADPGNMWIIPVSHQELVTPTEGVHCEESLVIGRGEDCDIRVDEPFVSERHAMLSARSDHWVLEDLETANGTFVDSLKIEGETRMEEGVCFSIGAVTFRLTRKNRSAS